MQIIDKCTYGNSPAAIALTERINRYNLPTRKLGALLSSFSRTLNELKKIDSKVALGLAKMCYKMTTENASKLPPEINTYVNNLVCGKYKEFLKFMNSQMAYKHRIN